MEERAVGEAGRAAPPSTAAEASQILEQLRSTALSHGRPDLGERLEATARQLTAFEAKVLVVGEYKAGKSALVDALVGAPVCPVDDDLATAVHTIVRFAPEPGATVMYEPDNGAGEPMSEPIPLEELADNVSEAGNPANARHLRAVEVGLPAELLADGLVIVDTPGLGGLASSYNAPTLAALPYADALLFVSDASQEYTLPELTFLRAAAESGTTVLGVMTKIDFYPEWHKVLDLDRGHLDRAGIECEIYPTSAALRERAVVTGDPDLDAESGYPVLLSVLRTDVIEAERQRTVRAVVADALSVAGQLESILVAEEEAADPERTEAVVAQLAAARERARQLAGPLAPWRQALEDDVADLQFRLEHRLQMGLRAVNREANSTIDASDPGSDWEEFEQWLVRRTTSEAAECHLGLSKGAAEVAQRLGERFAEAECDLAIFVDNAAPTAALEVLAPSACLGGSDLSAAAKGLTALEGSWSAIEPLSALGGAVGVGLLNPMFLVVGLVMGRRAIRQERSRKVEERREQAKEAVREYLDEVRLEVGKDLRERIRRIHRTTRDTATARATELERSIGEAELGARRAARAGHGARDERLRGVRAELDGIRGLRDRARALAPELTTTSLLRGGRG
ncbi:MAG TPA: dynamin family protein [Acidimicrobiales bacterium]|nr:dynamin family protein [Acidimicrobiales bacterium]